MRWEINLYTYLHCSSLGRQADRSSLFVLRRMPLLWQWMHGLLYRRLNSFWRQNAVSCPLIMTLILSSYWIENLLKQQQKMLGCLCRKGVIVLCAFPIYSVISRETNYRDCKISYCLTKFSIRRWVRFPMYFIGVESHVRLLWQIIDINSIGN